MTILQAIHDGIRRVNDNKRYLFIAFFASLGLSAVLALVVSNSIQSSLGNSLAADRLLENFDGLWYRSFSATAHGLAKTFEPGVVGIGAVLKSLDAFITGQFMQEHAAVLKVGAIYWLLWVLFSAGFISRFVASGEDKPGFWASAARYFFRFIILAVMAVIVYVLAFRLILGGLTSLVNEWTRETIDERVHFVLTVGKYLIFWLIVWFVNMIFDYSKIITVVQDRKNMLFVPLRALGFVVPRFFKAYGLYLSIGLIWIGIMLVYWIVVPGAGQSSWPGIALAFLLGQLYILSRIWTRCLFWGAQAGFLLTESAGPEDTGVEADKA